VAADRDFDFSRPQVRVSHLYVPLRSIFPATEFKIATKNSDDSRGRLDLVKLRVATWCRAYYVRRYGDHHDC